MPRIWLLLLALPALAPLAQAETALGDAGHYLMCSMRMHLNNPTGRPFTLTFHRMQWWIGAGGWNTYDLPVSVTAPDGTAVFAGPLTVEDDRGATITVKDAQPGVYRVKLQTRDSLNYWYLASSLDQSVVHLGAPDTEAWYENDMAFFVPMVARKWYFWVPAGTQAFTLQAQNNRGRSQREDHGLTIYSPRGQRIAVLWGQANPDEPTVAFGRQKLRVQRARVLVEPGSAGRFWAIEVRMGDSHTFTDVNFTLDGVPPYVARSPEEWFDPATGRRPPVSPYDDDEFMQSDRSEQSRGSRWEHWTPCPSLGDPDTDQLPGDTRFALWNPAGRALKFAIGTYLPRGGFPPEGQPAAPLDIAALTFTTPDGHVVRRERIPLTHAHAEAAKSVMLDPTPGVLHVEVGQCEHYLAYTYPATPAVLVGNKQRDGWQRFLLENGTARNWYFFVPKGAKRVRLRARAAEATDIMELQVNAPDRTLAMVYANHGEASVAVPAGLDGKIWHVRIDVGSATHFRPALPTPRVNAMRLTLDLKGVPGYLAPTWEQWFDPKNPQEVWDR